MIALISQRPLSTRSGRPRSCQCLPKAVGRKAPICGRKLRPLEEFAEGHMSNGRVVSVACDGAHRFSKRAVPAIEVAAGLGVKGDAHEGVMVKHRSRVAVDPSQPNLRQVHLIHAELFEELALKGFSVGPADLGENITTCGIDLLTLPRHTLILIGHDVRLEVTGLRNPCAQIERFKSGLLAAVLDRGPNNELIRKAGIMSIVKGGGVVRPGDQIHIEMPPQPHFPLERV